MIVQIGSADERTVNTDRVEQTCDTHHIELFVTLDGDEIYLFLVQDPDINLISAPKQFNGNDVFGHTSVIQIFGSQLRIPEGMVAQIQLIAGGQVLFSLNAVPANAIERKGVAQILHIVPDSFVVDLILVACECIRDIVALGLRVLIKIRSGHTALSQIPGESCIPVREGIIFAELTKRKWEHLHFKGSPREKRSKI